MRTRALLLSIIGVLALPAMVSAAPLDAVQANIESVFQVVVQNGRGTPALDRKLKVERDRAKTAIQEELQQLEKSLDVADLDAVKKQQQLLASLEEQQREMQADMDLLRVEEQRIYKPGVVAGSGTILDDQYRLTKTYPELLARLTILDARSEVTTAFITLQQDKLSRLQTQARWELLGTYFKGFKYLIILLLIVFAESALRRLLAGKIRDPSRRFHATKFVTMAAYTGLILWLFIGLNADFPGILTSFAILGAGVAVAMQDVIRDMIGWVMIVQRRLYFVGQRITIGNVTGDVIDVGLMRTTILEMNHDLKFDPTRSGQLVQVPNALVLREPVINYHQTSDYVDTEVVFLLTPLSNVARAEQIVAEVLEYETAEFVVAAKRQTSKRMREFYHERETLGPRTYVETTVEGIRLVLRFPVPIGERRLVMSKVTKSILEKFQAERGSISLAVNTK